MNIKCIDCGRFISYKDIEEGKAKSERSYAWDGEPIEDYYIHVNCKETEK